MKKLISIIGGMLSSFAFVTVVSASTNTVLNMYPEMAPNVIGVAGDYAPGYSFGSFAADGSYKTDMYFTPIMLFENDITLGDIESMSYWTKKDTTHFDNPADWYLTIYTKPYEGDLGTWYGERIGTEPYFSINMADPVNTWNQWSTDGSVNQLRFFESTLGYFGGYTDPAWDTFVGGNALSGSAYAGHEVMYFSIQTGSAWANGFTGQIDGFQITLKDGSVATINFETEVVYPTGKDQCKKDLWKTFIGLFKNQGDCVSFVQSNPKATGNKNK